MERVVVRGAGTVGIIGAIIFFIAKLDTIAIYLLVAGAAFWIFSLGWGRRYEHVLDKAPEGYRPTGEVYTNPGGDGPVAVYFKGIRRIYVKAE